MTEKNIFVYNLFLLLICYAKTAAFSLKKLPPSFPATPSKIWDPVSSLPPFLKTWLEAQCPPPAERGEGVCTLCPLCTLHYVLDLCYGLMSLGFKLPVTSFWHHIPNVHIYSFGVKHFFLLGSTKSYLEQQVFYLQNLNNFWQKGLFPENSQKNK